MIQLRQSPALIGIALLLSAGLTIAGCSDSLTHDSDQNPVKFPPDGGAAGGDEQGAADGGEGTQHRPDASDTGRSDGGEGIQHRPDASDMGRSDGGEGIQHRPDASDMGRSDGGEGIQHRPDASDMGRSDGGEGVQHRPDAGDMGLSDAGDAQLDGGVILEPSPAKYRGTCDGSLGVAIDGSYFLDGNDEDQMLRLYRRTSDAAPVMVQDFNSLIGLADGEEADVEDAALIGTRIYVIGSHGRTGKGKLERSRYRFFALDLSGTAPNLTLAGAGYTGALLDDMLETSNWANPDAAIIQLLTERSRLSEAKVPALSPKIEGISIEGLAWLPTAERPNQLLIGFRNPQSSDDAILVSLLNADAVLAGEKARFGEATQLDLDGLGVRALSWSPAHHALLIVGGPNDERTGPFRMFKWSGVAGEAAEPVADLTAPADSAPEAIVVYPDTHDVQVLFDQGNFLIDGVACKDAVATSRFFGDVIVHVP